MIKFFKVRGTDLTLNPPFIFSAIESVIEASSREEAVQLYLERFPNSIILDVYVYYTSKNKAFSTIII